MSPNANPLVMKGPAAQQARPVNLLEPVTPAANHRLDPHRERHLSPLFDQRPAGWDEGYAAGLEQGLRDGREQGRRQGQDDGRQEALRAGRTEVDDALAALAATITRSETELKAVADQHAEALANWALELASMILQREIATCNDPGAEALARCLAVAPTAGDMVAHLNPGDVETLSPDHHDRLKVGDRQLKIVADPEVQRGDAIIKFDQATVDGRIAHALDRVAQVLA